ncbi:MAG: type 1 glutamine amidotransferase [Cytophagaceae bacterium]
MNIHYLRHVQFEGLGTIKEWAKVPENKLTATKFYEDNKLPFVDLFDVLIIMGGPMSVHDEKLYPWLKQEKQLIARAIEKRKKVIGICLGAQLIAEVLGAKVYKNEHKEIGWFPVELTNEAKSSVHFQNFPPNPIVFHWHGETFDLPSNAVRLASSEACLNQAFMYEDNVLALQFHLEMEKTGIENLISNCADDLVESKYIQQNELLLSDSHFSNNKNLLFELLNSFCK